MRFQMYWGDTQVAEGETLQAFGKERIEPGDQLASAIRVYQVREVIEQPDGSVRLQAEPA
jgi:hypothetical protein